MAARGSAWAAWVDRLPATARSLLADWELEPDGTATHGHCSLVLPVRTAAGAAAVLKAGFVEEENEHEPVALQQWQGHGAVRLLRADPRRGALLLERLHARDLTTVGDLEACEVVAALYERLHVPALPQLRPLSAYVGRWAERLARLPRSAPIPPRLVQQASSVAADLIAEPDVDARVIHADLHHGNVLGADRAPWLAIDPKPVNGDPHYEPAPMLWNRYAELGVDRGDRSVREGLRRRFHALVDAGGLDEDRARDWVVVRSVVNAMWSHEDAVAQSRDLTVEERALVTRCVTVAKAVQD